MPKLKDARECLGQSLTQLHELEKQLQKQKMLLEASIFNIETPMDGSGIITNDALEAFFTQLKNDGVTSKFIDDLVSLREKNERLDKVRGKIESVQNSFDDQAQKKFLPVDDQLNKARSALEKSNSVIKIIDDNMWPIVKHNEDPNNLYPDYYITPEKKDLFVIENPLKRFFQHPLMLECLKLLKEYKNRSGSDYFDDLTKLAQLKEQQSQKQQDYDSIHRGWVEAKRAFDVEQENNKNAEQKLDALYRGFLSITNFDLKKLEERYEEDRCDIRRAYRYTLDGCLEDISDKEKSERIERLDQRRKREEREIAENIYETHDSDEIEQNYFDEVKSNILGIVKNQSGLSVDHLSMLIDKKDAEKVVVGNVKAAILKSALCDIEKRQNHVKNVIETFLKKTEILNSHHLRDGEEVFRTNIPEIKDKMEFLSGGVSSSVLWSECLMESLKRFEERQSSALIKSFKNADQKGVSSFDALFKSSLQWLTKDQGIDGRYLFTVMNENPLVDAESFGIKTANNIMESYQSSFTDIEVKGNIFEKKERDLYDNSFRRACILRSRL